MNTRHCGLCRTFVAVLAISTTLGCGRKESSGPLRLIPVKGMVTVKGRAALGAIVTLYAVSGPAVGTGVYPHGIADETGQFALTTYTADDGAPVGEYQITVVWPDSEFQPKTVEQIDAVMSGDDPPDKLGGRYGNPKQSRLTAEILENTTELPDLELR